MFVTEILCGQMAQIGSDATLRTAAAQLAHTGVSELMVVDADGTFLGLLSEEAILATLVPDSAEVFAIGGTIDDLRMVFGQMSDKAAKRSILPLVTADVVTLHPGTDVVEAALTFMTQQYRHLPLVKQGKLVGTVSRAALCRAALSGTAPQMVTQTQPTVLEQIGVTWSIVMDAMRVSLQFLLAVPNVSKSA